jgi:hypothetical protein
MTPDRIHSSDRLVVGTMGPLTCAADALRVHLDGEPHHQPAFFRSFEAVREALVEGAVDRALVPHCHPIATELLFDPRFDVDVDGGFNKPNPQMHLATLRDRRLPDRVLRCASLPILWPLVAMLEHPRLAPVAVVSNPAAADAVVSGEADVAVTNDVSLTEYGLRSLHKLKHVAVRWFLVRSVGASAVRLDDEPSYRREPADVAAGAGGHG